MAAGSVKGFLDLHCHWLPGIDDGARSIEASVAMLEGLKEAGFDDVVATPHMRPAMWENDRAALTATFERTREALGGPRHELPRVHLASEHWLDDVVFARLVQGEGLPYPALGDALRGGKRGVLVELPPRAFPPRLERRFFDLGRAGLRPVLAHPERYEPVWKDDRCLDPLLDAGALLLLDVCALVGKYGRASQRAAERLLDDGAYEAACSDAHRPEDVDAVVRAVTVLEARAGKEESQRLLRDAPRAILGLAS